MSDTGKKISLAGFALGVLANIVWFIGFILGNRIISEGDFISFFCEDAYSVLMIISLLAIVIGYALKFLDERDIFYILIAVFTFWTFISLALPYFGYPISLGNIYVDRILHNLFLLLIAVNTFRKGNMVFAALLISAFLFLALVVPFVNVTLFYNFSNSLIMIFIAIISVAELGAFGVAALSELQER